MDNQSIIWTMIIAIIIVYTISLIAKLNTPAETQNIEYSSQLNTTATAGNATNDAVESIISGENTWQGTRLKILQRDGNKCTSCGATSRLTVDHILELELGGTNALSNLRTLCADCHEDRHQRKFMDREFASDPHYGENYMTNPKVAALNGVMNNKLGTGIKYVDRQGLYSERVIHPTRIWRSHYVYVEAYDDLDKATRTFRISRMKLTKGRLNFYDNASNSYTGTWIPDEAWKKTVRKH